MIQFSPTAEAFAAAALGAALSAGVGRWLCVASEGGDALRRAAAVRVIAERGGTVAGTLEPRRDDAALAEEAHRSGATGLVFCGAGAELVADVRRARRLGLASGRALVGLQVDQADVAALGADAAGLTFATPFFPAMSGNALQWSGRFLARHAAQPPGWRQALAYSAVLHYLRAARASGGVASEAVVGWMREQPVRDALFRAAPAGAKGAVPLELSVVRVRRSDGSGALHLVERLTEAER